MALVVEITNSCVSGFIPVLLTGVQLDSILYLFSISVFEVDITFWVRLLIAFWRWGWKQVCFKNYLLDDTLNSHAQDGDSNILHNDDDNDDDNNNHVSDIINDDKKWW